MADDLSPEDEEVLGDPDTHQLAQTMLEEARNEIARADEKASLLIGGLGIVLTILAAGLVEAGWTLEDIGPAGLIFLALGTLAAADSVIASAMAIWPRVSKPVGGAITYWGHVKGFRNGRDLAHALHDRGLREPERTYQQLMVLSLVTQRKYANIRRSMASAGIAAVLYGVGLLLGS